MKQEDKKQRNYQAGAVKRMLGIKKGEPVRTGDFLKKANSLKEKVAIRGLI